MEDWLYQNGSPSLNKELFLDKYNFNIDICQYSFLNIKKKHFLCNEIYNTNKSSMSIRKCNVIC